MSNKVPSDVYDVDYTYPITFIAKEKEAKHSNVCHMHPRGADIISLFATSSTEEQKEIIKKIELCSSELTIMFARHLGTNKSYVIKKEIKDDQNLRKILLKWLLTYSQRLKDVGF